MQARILRQLDRLDVIVRPEEMNVPGFDFHPLRGFKPTRYSVHVNGPWCVTFEFEDGGRLSRRLRTISLRTVNYGFMSPSVLPYNHIHNKYYHMKTTLNIDDRVMLELKREAARQGRTMSEMVESALRLLLRSQRKREKIAPLPTFRSGGALVDVADRDALYQAMEGR